jgi:hypothetical protein
MEEKIIEVPADEAASDGKEGSKDEKKEEKKDEDEAAKKDDKAGEKKDGDKKDEAKPKTVVKKVMVPRLKNMHVALKVGLGPRAGWLGAVVVRLSDVGRS